MTNQNTLEMSTYQEFQTTATEKQWKRIGLQRRAGVAVPLFSIYSKSSIGIGEIPDLKLLVDWCRTCGMSIIQLLPLNDVGFSYRPYDAQSSFALEPIYLSLNNLRDVNLEMFKAELENLRQEFPAGGSRVNYKIKTAKLDLLWAIFNKSMKRQPEAFKHFKSAHSNWLEDYSVYRVLKEQNHESSWETWDIEFRQRNPGVLWRFKGLNMKRINFYKWIQWQLHEQFQDVKEFAAKKNVFFMGDLPFLVSRDSADVWAHQDYFKLDLSAGAPPDAFFAQGQRWGMPPYRWDRISEEHFAYHVKKLRYAEKFYDLFRIDHVVGVFRLWTIPLTEPLENGGLNGVFDPKDEQFWEEHGRRIISMIVSNTEMLPCAEDLGVVPDCSYRVLKEYGIPGMDVQRWARDWHHGHEFLSPERYRPNSIATISTHDMSCLLGWWQYEIGTVDEAFYKRICEEKGIPFEQIKHLLFAVDESKHGRLRWRKEVNNISCVSQIVNRPEWQISDLLHYFKATVDEKEKFLEFLEIQNADGDKDLKRLVRLILEKANATSSIFSIQLLQDWLSLGGTSFLKGDSWDYRINFPGTISDQNWSLVMPASLEKMLELDINDEIKIINQKTGRI